MSHCSLNALLNSQSSRFCFEFRLVFHSEQDLFSEEEIAEKTVKLERINVSTADDSSDLQWFQFAVTNKDVGELKLDLRIDQSSITFSNVKLGSFEHCDKLGDYFKFNVDPEQVNGLCLNGKTFQESSQPFVRLYQRSIGVDFYFCLNASIENYSGPSERDQDICAVLQRPSVDLLTDWVFCGHSHSHSADSHNHKPESINIPEELLKPIVLDRIEQVIYLLADSPQILLESIDNKDKSIYLEFIKSYVYAFNYLRNYQVKQQDCEVDEKSVNGEQSRFMNGNIQLSLLEKCLVQHQIFAQQCSSTSTEDEQTRPTYQHYYSQDKTLLKKYRMSFEVEWYRVEETLYSDLADLLVDSSETLRRLKDNFGDDLIDTSDCADSDLPIAVLENFKFVKPDS